VRIFLVGLYGVDNLGDDAIRLAIERAAPATGAVVDRFAVRRPGHPDPRAVRLRGRGWRRYVNACRRADRVVLGGGGLLKDGGSGLVHGYRGRGMVHGYGVLAELLLTAALARALGKQVTWVGMGAGPVHTKAGAWLIRAIAALTQRRVVRDDGARAELERAGVRGVEVHADPTFTLVNGIPEPAPGARRVLLSVRDWYTFHPERERRWAALRHALAAAARTALDRGHPVHFVPLYWPRDREVALEIARELDDPRVSVGDRPLDWDALGEELRCSRLLVAMRYHAVACALAGAHPVIPVAYEPKVAALAQQAGLIGLGVDDPDLAETLPRAVADELDRPRRAPDRTAVERLREQAWAGVRRSLG
jgi:polysaccharide pyruvyl transferase WcaK-like protein